MKQIICIALLITLPFLVFAQEYSLTLKGTRDRVVCDILGAANGYLYYQTATQSMVVVPVANVKTLYQGRNDPTPAKRHGHPLQFGDIGVFANCTGLCDGPTGYQHVATHPG